jgi:hypothetical protein
VNFSSAACRFFHPNALEVKKSGCFLELGQSDAEGFLIGLFQNLGDLKNWPHPINENLHVNLTLKAPTALLIGL